uniref:Uncharacterized protein n=1 Tax=Ciona intestinalis TaxID=7719 RepID=H2XW03_CIOIN
MIKPYYPYNHNNTVNNEDSLTNETNEHTDNHRYPVRNRRPPEYLRDGTFI